MPLSKPKLQLNIPRNLAIIAVSIFFWGLGEGLFIFFLPLTLQRWDASTVLIGGILSMIGVVMTLVQVPSGYLSDRLGTRPLVLTGMLLGIAAALVMAFSTGLVLFAVGLLAYGMTSLINPPLNSFVTSLRGKWTVQRAMTFIGAAGTIGGILGPVIGGKIADVYGLDVVFRFSSGLFVISMLVFLLTRRSEVQSEPEAESAIQKVSPLKNLRFLGLLALLIVTIVFLSVPQQLTSMYLQNIQHISTQQIGMMGTLSGIVTALMMLVLGNLNPSIGMFIGQLMIAGFALLMWRGQGLAAFFAGYALIGGYRLYRVMALAYSRSLVNEGNVGLAYGLVDTGNALAMIAAPLLAGVLYEYQPVSVYTVSLVALIVTMGLNYLFMKKKRASAITN
ncbi:MAG: MFS transporter [Anaerolineae bacterium]|nr:MFS transporter [Anaerolineae bacterium]